TYGEKLLSILKKVTDKKQQQNLYSKITIMHIVACVNFGQQNINMAQTVIQQLQGESFDIKNYDDMFQSIDLNQFSNTNYQYELTEEEQSILKFIEQFDEAMKQHAKSSGNKNKKSSSSPLGDGDGDGDDDEDIPQLNNKDFEPKIGGFSFTDASQTVQLAYILGIFLAIFSIILL
ncbi:hypothetical protein IMG5_190400, partial [Ichthyophthirius multifiliis]